MVPSGAACSLILLLTPGLHLHLCLPARHMCVPPSLTQGQCPPSAPISAPLAVVSTFPLPPPTARHYLHPPPPQRLHSPCSKLPSRLQSPIQGLLLHEAFPARAAWLGWSGWSIVPIHHKVAVPFPSRAQTQVAGSTPGRAHMGGNHPCFSLPLSAFSPGPLSTYPGWQHFLTCLCHQSPAHPLAPDTPPPEQSRGLPSSANLSGARQSLCSLDTVRTPVPRPSHPPAPTRG